MINFVVYHYTFPKPDPQDIYAGIYKDDVTLNQELSEKLKEASKSDKGINLYFEQAKGRNRELEVTRYPNLVEAHSQGVFLLSLHTVKTRSLTPADGKDKISVGDYPWCWVVIDTRPQSQLILIQRKSEVFSKNTDFVADLLLGDYCQRELDLSMNGTHLHLEKRLCEGMLWEVIRQRSNSGKDRLKSLYISVSERKADQPLMAANATDAALQFILHSFNSPDAELKVNPQTIIEDIIKGRKPDCIGLAEVLLTYNYTIRAEFERSGTYECGKDTETIYGALDSVVENFGKFDQEGHLLADAQHLISWINETILKDNTYYYTDCLKKYGRKRKPKPGA